MDDLIELNQRICAQLPPRNANLISVLGLVRTCVGTLIPNEEELTAAVRANEIPQQHQNPPAVEEINRDYLVFARQTCRDIIRGGYDGLIVLGVTLSQARALAALTTRQIDAVAKSWRGYVFRVREGAAKPAPIFHSAAVPHYSAAILAA